MGITTGLSTPYNHSPVTCVLTVSLVITSEANYAPIYIQQVYGYKEQKGYQ